MPKSTTKDDDAAELRHPKEIAADWRKLRDNSAAQGAPRNAADAQALLDEFIESVAASYGE